MNTVDSRNSRIESRGKPGALPPSGVGPLRGPLGEAGTREDRSGESQALLLTRSSHPGDEAPSGQRKASTPTVRRQSARLRLPRNSSASLLRSRHQGAEQGEGGQPSSKAQATSESVGWGAWGGGHGGSPYSRFAPPLPPGPGPSLLPRRPGPHGGGSLVPCGRTTDSLGPRRRERQVLALGDPLRAASPSLVLTAGTSRRWELSRRRFQSMRRRAGSGAPQARAGRCPVGERRDKIPRV